MARPFLFNEAVAEEICIRLAGGDSLAKICRDEGIPAWRTKNRKELVTGPTFAVPVRSCIAGLCKSFSPWLPASLPSSALSVRLLRVSSLYSAGSSEPEPTRNATGKWT